MNTMNPAALAAADQAQAKERDFEKKAVTTALIVLWLGLALGTYSYLGLRGDVPLPSWSPAGQHQLEQQERNTPQFSEGNGVAV